MEISVRDQRGQVVVFFALLLPVLIALGAVVVGLGNWFVHTKHLQTKVDASALAAGSAWAFPCTAGSDAPIITAAREYAGPHIDAGGTLHPTAGEPTYNQQVGGVPGNDVQVRLNANDWFDDDAGINPADFTTPPSPDGLCATKTLDVKATEVNSFPLASIIPLFPDLKRKARVEIQEPAEVAGPGLLPLAVRVPKPLNAAAVFVNEEPGANFGRILSAVYMRDVCEPQAFSECIAGMPSGLDHWTTDDGSQGNRATITSMPTKLGVVIALSHRPKCPGTACFNIDYTQSTLDTINEFCNQGTTAIAQCYYTTGTPTQTFQSGLQFIRGWSSNADAPPDLLSTWIEPPVSGNFCYQGYFSAPLQNDCNVTLHANYDPGFGGVGTTELRYKLVSGDTAWQQDDAPGLCNAAFSGNCVMPGGVATLTLDRQYVQHAVGIAILRGNLPPAVIAANGLPNNCANAPNLNCAWFYPDFGGTPRSMTIPSGNQGAAAIFANPVQRAFMGEPLSSGPVKYLHLKNIDCSNGNVPPSQLLLTGEAASVQLGQRCFRLEMGLQGALARQQDEYPIQINLGTTSQSSVVDCDPDKSNMKQEIEEGCGTPDGSPSYVAHDFARTDTQPGGSPYCPDESSANQFFDVTPPKPAPYENWEPITCVLTQTSNAVNQVMSGFNQRIFGVQNNPSCPADNALYVKGRNYWHDANNSFSGDPDDPDGAGPLDGPLAPQEDFYTFTRSGRLEPTENPAGPGQPHPNRLRLDDPRFVLLFISPYNSFTGNGNENYPIVAIGGFYITGYGRLSNGGGLTIEDPCSQGSSAPGAGNTPPPDLDPSSAPGAIAWGHFVVAVNMSAPGGGNGNPCQEAAPTDCVPVLVE